MAQYNPLIHHRKSIRLKYYDYSQNGLYFVTICCKNKRCLLGDIMAGDVLLSPLGNIAQRCWLDIPLHFPFVKLHPFIVMPNHIHGIIEICQYTFIQHNTPTLYGTSKTLGSIISGFKIGVTKWAKQHDVFTPVWQPNYYEHIIRNEKSYTEICEYISNNPFLWQQDRFYV